MQASPLSPDAVVDGWIDRFRRFGTRPYDAATVPSEPVSQKVHACQAAMLARDAGAPPALVAAALLHDLGHLVGREEADGSGLVDLHHESVAAHLVGAHLPREVTDPILLHVAAKRYLVAVEPSYSEVLSEASAHSLRLQGGPLDPRAVAEFEALPHAEAAVALRRWDDAAKDPRRATPPLEEFVPLLVGLVSAAAVSR